MSEKYLNTQPYKGSRDFYPEEQRIQHWMFERLREGVERYGYQEYNGPMLEPFELYAAKSGEEIVNQQLYAFMDRGERKVAIRPEMTPTMARMVAKKIHELPRPIRWFSFPNLWRYERPQRGRLREHWQLNVDVLGGDTLLADAEILCLSLDLMKIFSGEKSISIRVNHRQLVDFFLKDQLSLSPETGLAVTKAIDARAKIGEEAYLKWLSDLGLDSETQKKIEGFFHSPLEEVAAKFPCPGAQELVALFSFLEESGLREQIQFDPLIMRGMNYYTGMVFEVYDTSPENKRAMFGGGRYDNLIGLFGNAKLSGVGFGMGDVTLRDFLEVHGLLPSLGTGVDVFVTLPHVKLRVQAEKMTQELRARRLCVMTPLEVSGFGQQLKMASKHGAAYAVILGEAELAKKAVVVKNLKTSEQKEVLISELANVLCKELGNNQAKE